ncbi:MAG TPA: hypothetical protein VFE62_06920 [Gemmataceae bacterium]|nr:hypothetical protein [Pirellulales bacterium]HZZ78232.1 hypothetical protein [Gemmataceae bacterium]
MVNDLAEIIDRLEEIRARADSLDEEHEKVVACLTEAAAQIKAAQEHIAAADKRIRKSTGHERPT